MGPGIAKSPHWARDKEHPQIQACLVREAACTDPTLKSEATAKHSLYSVFGLVQRHRHHGDDTAIGLAVKLSADCVFQGVVGGSLQLNEVSVKGTRGKDERWHSLWSNSW